MNQDIKSFLDAFLAELIDGNAAVFAGAGLSVPAGFVDWKELMRPLSDELGLDIDLESDMPALAQFHVNANGQNRHGLHKAVIDAISPDKSPTKNHELLARLPIPVYWTTNYDKLIENSLNAVGKKADVKIAVSQLALTRKGREAIVYKMHGDVDRPDEAVATRDDFERYDTDRGAFTSALAGDLVTRTFLFLGFSFTDPNLSHVLSRLRLTFKTNQRKHYAIFKRRGQLKGESDAEFAHYSARQAHVVEDLKRYNVKVLLIDEYAEITELLEELNRRYSRRTALVSGSADYFAPWGQEAVTEFAQQLGAALIASGCRVATGLGVGIGNDVFTGSLREIMRQQDDLSDSMVLRPFPQNLTEAERKKTWQDYREELVSNAGIAIFIFGNKVDGDGQVILAEGVAEEFGIARKAGLALIPIGATGYTAERLATELLREPGEIAPAYGKDELALIERLAAPTDNLKTLIEPTLELVARLRGKSK